jgi:hypothetical protein
VEDVVRLMLHNDVAKERFASEFHEISDKGSVWGFAFALDKFDQIEGLDPLYVRWDETGELQQITAIGVEGSFSGEQSRLDFGALLLDGRTFAVAEGSMLGRDVVWVASEKSDTESTLSWHFLDVPADP